MGALIHRKGDKKTMSFSHEALLQVAHLARLTITDPVQQQKDLDRIVSMVEKIEAIDTQGIIPMAHPLDMTQRLEPDTVTETPDRDKIQACAPVPTEAGLYLVPQVIE